MFGARPARLPLSIGDPTIVTGSTAVVSMLELFGYYLQRGLVDVGFLGAAQIDRFGNINTTVIGDYAHPTTRLPGSGGACEIAINARKVFVIMRQSRRSFVDRIDFRTSPGNLGGAEQAERIRREGGWLGRGPSIVVTDLGVYRFDETGEMRLDSLHPGATLDAVRETIGWEHQDCSPTSPRPRPDGGGAAADPRGARSRGRLHEVGARSVRRPGSPGADDEHRALRVADDVVGHAADEEAAHGPRPWLPTTIMSAPSASAASMIDSPGSPSHTRKSTRPRRSTDRGRRATARMLALAAHLVDALPEAAAGQAE